MSFLLIFLSVWSRFALDVRSEAYFCIRTTYRVKGDLELLILMLPFYKCSDYGVHESTGLTNCLLLFILPTDSNDTTSQTIKTLVFCGEQVEPRCDWLKQIRTYVVIWFKYPTIGGLQNFLWTSGCHHKTSVSML